MNEAVAIVLLILIGVFAIITGHGFVSEWRKNMDVQFRSLRLPSPDPRLAFDGSTATVVYDRDTGQRVIHRICKNVHGEYFLFVYTVQLSGWGGSSYLVHLTRERAINALGVHRGAFEREFGPDAQHQERSSDA